MRGVRKMMGEHPPFGLRPWCVVALSATLVLAGAAPAVAAPSVYPSLGIGVITEHYGAPDCCPYLTDVEIGTFVSPSRIDPGQPFTGINSWKQTRTGNAPNGCTASPSTREEKPITSLAFVKVPEGGTSYLPGLPTAQLAATGTEVHTSTAGCDTSTTFRQVDEITWTFSIPAGATQALSPGCYQPAFHSQGLMGNESGTVAVFGVGVHAHECAPPLPECKDSLNNDLDGPGSLQGLVDSADPGCTGPDDPSELGTLECDNGSDDDDDGKADWPSDPGCTGPVDPSELGTLECDNGSDDDGDGKADSPTDPGCTSPGDDSERDDPPPMATDDAGGRAPGGEGSPSGGRSEVLVRRAFQLLKVSVARNRRSLTLMISCPAAALDCTGGKAKLATAKKVARPAARRKRILALGSATFAIRSGTAATVKLKLNRTARKLLARGRIKGKLTLSVGDSPAKPLLTTRDLTIRPPARKRR